MFYSHEVLTSRKYGVATVWLVATLGAKSTLKKVTRRAILDVDVPKACETILTPEVPMALRLQSNLLFGVTRVYSQQCGYVLADAQSAHNAIKAQMRVMRSSELDLDGTRVRPEQLMLQDDPAFIPEFAMPDIADLESFGLELGNTAHSLDSSFLSPHSTKGGRARSVEGSMLQAPGEEMGDDFPRGADTSEAGVRERDELDWLTADPGFSFDADGGMRETGIDALDLGIDLVGPGEGMEGMVPGPEIPQEAGPTVEPIIGGEDPVMAQADPESDFLAVNTPRTLASEPPAPVNNQQQQEEVEEDVVDLPLRRRGHQLKTLGMDAATELRNSDLSAWNTNYVENMDEATRSKHSTKVAAAAKKNAEFWTFGSGINGVGEGIGLAHLPGPFQLFSGAYLLATFGLGIAPTVPSKRRREEDEEGLGSEHEQRRTRQRGEDEVVQDEDQAGQEAQVEEAMAADINEPIPLIEEDTIEIGRQAVSALADRSSIMPWNVSASRRDSSVTRGRGLFSAGPGSISGVGGPSSLPHDRDSLPHRIRRQTSASPLAARGQSHLERSSILGITGDLAADLDDDFLLGANNSTQAAADFEMYGPAAAVDTQTAAQSQWLRDTLGRESANFLDFVATKLADQPLRPALKGEGDERFVLFEELLPPRESSTVMAAQAIYHTLYLATRNMVRVAQAEPYGDISLVLIEGA
ncbi:MAG: hypothetical protein M1829_000328 [Trizodia sp. TS-e1964]|nr:MAG: hypothetical protein M1829_000328 [Trizodia sp. TS-e1964]